MEFLKDFVGISVGLKFLSRPPPPGRLAPRGWLLPELITPAWTLTITINTRKAKYFI